MRKNPIGKVNQLPLRMLAQLGDAVSILYERQRAVFYCASAKQMHRVVKERINAKAQAGFLDRITELLTEQELDLVRRARNLKTAHRSRSQHANYHKATAFEALIGYLYMSNMQRLNELLEVIDRSTYEHADHQNLKDKL